MQATSNTVDEVDPSLREATSTIGSCVEPKPEMQNTDKRINDYLDTVFKQPLMSVFNSQRTTLKDQATLRLMEMVATAGAAGVPWNEAYAAKVQSFEQSDPIVLEWAKIQHLDKALVARRSVQVANVSFNVATFILAVMILVFAEQVDEMAGGPFALFFYLFLPAAAGVTLGLAAPPLKMRTAFGIATRLLIPTLTIYVVLAIRLTYVRDLGDALSWDHAEMLCFAHLMSWPVVAVPTAMIGGALRKWFISWRAGKRRQRE